MMIYIIDLLISLFESYLFIKFMKVRHRIRYPEHETAVVVLLGILIFLKFPLVEQGVHELLCIMGLFLMQMIISRAVFIGTLSSKGISIAMFFLLLVASESLVLGLLVIRGELGLLSTMNLTNAKLMGMVLSKMLLYVGVQSYTSSCKNVNYEMINKEMITEVFLLITLISSLAFMVFPLGPTGSHDVPGTMILKYAIASIAVILLYERLASKIQHQSDERVRMQLLQSQIAYFEQVDALTGQLSRLKHDVNKHLGLIDQYAQFGEYDRIHTYIKTLQDNAETDRVHLSSIPVLNYLLTYYSSKMDQRDVAFVISQDIDCEMAIKDVDLCIVLGNMLDNALDAVICLPVERRRVKLHISVVSQCVLLHCCNVYNNELHKKGHIYLSTKERNKHSGMGISNIRHVADQYDGDVEITHSGEEFTISVVLQNINNNISRNSDQTA